MKKEIPFYINLLLLVIICSTLAKMGCYFTHPYYWIITLCSACLFVLGRIYEDVNNK